jgi:hypothetical protein
MKNEQTETRKEIAADGKTEEKKRRELNADATT